MRFKWIVLIALLALSAVWMLSRHSLQAEIFLVERADLDFQCVLEGEVTAPPSAYTEVHVSNTGRVVSVKVAEGDVVSEGDALVEFEYSDSTTHLGDARERLATAERDYRNARALNEPRLEELKAKAQAAAEVSEAGRGRTTLLGVLTIESPAQESTEQRILAQAIAESEVQLKPLRERLELARRDVHVAQEGGRFTLIRAPQNGHVVEVATERDHQPGKDEPLITLADLSRVKVHLPLSIDSPESMAAARVNARVSLWTKYGDTSAEGLIEAISSEQGSEQVAVAGLERYAGKPFKPGDRVQAEVTYPLARSVLAVPISAVSEGTVLVSRDGEWSRVTVELGVDNGHLVEVTSGLREGDVVRKHFPSS